ncbi:hypothetical protein N7508_003110 [Penicillium antarcticum]|uniref:uncharacterized protein n=1 Tax=Penicillium antarcticum TaxID=416450 RepID=UPI002397FF82|nr:uncharacterized protein N7508_003110 [Penicillium antarcticum]KAJ5312280.1 hypothetical protein N7508_003110 [Penicillium antarcticum]
MSNTRILPWFLTKSASACIVLGLGAYCTRSFILSTGHAESNEPPKVFPGFGVTTLRLQSAKDVNHNTKRLVFEFADQIAKSGLTLTYQPGSLVLMVKRYPNGKASNHLHSLVPGDTLTFAAAIKGESWTSNKYPQIYAIAGGAGITPIYQLVQGILNNPEDKTKIKLVFGVNTEQDLLLKEELQGFKTRFPDRFDYFYTVSRPTGHGGSEDGNGEVRRGYITEELLRGVVTADGDARVFVCGPHAMEEALVGSWEKGGILARIGFRKDQVCKF